MANAQTRIRVELNDGSTREGPLQEISSDGLVVDSQPVIPFEELRIITSEATAEAPLASQSLNQLTLVGGSSFICSDLEFADGLLRCTSNGRDVEFKAENLLTLQLNTLTGEQAEAWETISNSAADGDLAVLIKKSGALTKIEGIVEGIANEVVLFDFDGTIDLPFAKVAGLRFYSPTRAEMPRTQAVVEDIHGNVWMFSQLTSDGVSLTGILRCGESVTFPANQLRQLDYSLANTSYLADLEWGRHSASTLFAFEGVDLGEGSLFGVQKVAPSWIPGKLTGPSLSFVGSGEVTFTIPEGFKTLRGSVNLKPKGNKVSPVRVDVSLENKVLWEAELAPSGEQETFEVAVRDGERLRLRVRGQGDLPVGDLVQWLEPKLLR